MAGRRSRRTSTPAAELPSELPPEEEEEEEEEEESDFEPVEPNLATRVKRSNAGNRMRALLDDEQGAEAEELFKEEVDDVEFKQKGQLLCPFTYGLDRKLIEYFETYFRGSRCV